MRDVGCVMGDTLNRSAKQAILGVFGAFERLYDGSPGVMNQFVGEEGWKVCNKVIY